MGRILCHGHGLCTLACDTSMKLTRDTNPILSIYTID
ncbi:hypothetical protein Goarm_021613 [Gossypium armourianum]|uniref:Uncharacterized protein n=1 Tax=Gossypium armourianum TaxID=34283 RepID=A0A7J9ISA3_9ROSI|nr:hypothetical protein [Gossypium armourianum]